MPSIYSRHQTFFPPPSVGRNRLGLPPSGASLSSESRRTILPSVAKESGHTSIASSQRGSSMTRNDRGQRFLSSSKMSFEDASRDPPDTVLSLDDPIANDDWGYFVDCDYKDCERHAPSPMMTAISLGVNVFQKHSHGSAFLKKGIAG